MVAPRLIGSNAIFVAPNLEEPRGYLPTLLSLIPLTEDESIFLVATQNFLVISFSWLVGPKLF